jgi:hypothetical protein
MQSTAPLILGVLALVVAVYVFVLVQRVQRDTKALKLDVETLASHLDLEITPALDGLRIEQEEFQLWMLSKFEEHSQATTSLRSSSLKEPGEDEIAEAMLRSMMFNNSQIGTRRVTGSQGSQGSQQERKTCIEIEEAESVTSHDDPDHPDESDHPDQTDQTDNQEGDSDEDSQIDDE